MTTSSVLTKGYGTYIVIIIGALSRGTAIYIKITKQANRTSYAHQPYTYYVSFYVTYILQVSAYGNSLIKSQTGLVGV